MRRALQTLVGLALLMAPGGASATTETLIAVDNAPQGLLNFDAGSDILATSFPVSSSEDAFVEVHSLLQGAILHLELLLDTVDPGITNSRFVGANAGDDLWITPAGGGAPLLTAEVNEIFVTNFTFTPSGSFPINTMTLGGFDPGQADISVTGGSAADIFGTSGGGLAIFLDALGPPPSALNPFGTSFDSPARIHMLTHTPEPSTFLLVAGCLVGLSAWRRRGSS